MKMLRIVSLVVVLVAVGCTSDEEANSWSLSENDQTTNNQTANNQTTNNQTFVDTTDGPADAGRDTVDPPDVEVDFDAVQDHDTGPPTDTTGVDTAKGCLPKVPAKHRPSSEACDSVRPTGNPPPADYSGPAECADDSDCTDGDNGRCVGNGHDGWRCTYDLCSSDGDCAGGKVCECDGGFRSDHNVCLSGNCQTDADCGPNGYCSPSFGSCGNYSGVVGYFCHTCQDECIDDSDCATGDDSNWGQPYCMYNDAVGHWVCSDSHCAG